MAARGQSSLLGLDRFESEEETGGGASFSMGTSQALTARGQAIVTRTQEQGLMAGGYGLLGQYIEKTIGDLEVHGAYTYLRAIGGMRAALEQATNEEDYACGAEYIGHRRRQLARNISGYLDIIEKRLAEIGGAPLDVSTEPVKTIRRLSLGERVRGYTDY